MGGCTRTGYGRGTGHRRPSGHASAVPDKRADALTRTARCLTLVSGSSVALRGADAADRSRYARRVQASSIVGHADKAHGAVRMHVVLPTPVEDVWQALTHGEHTAKWLGRIDVDA